ncbi:unnamed protein product, partial [Amoebophrya sp. A120]|eukprot:GSA120T00000386001.1
MGACQSSSSAKYEKPTKFGVQQDRLKNKQFEEDLAFLENVPLFSRLSKADLPIVVGALERREYSEGDPVIREGTEGDEFFLIKQGQALVSKDGSEIATLKPGDYFGEGSLLEDTPRNATITVAQNCATLIVLCLTRAKFEELGVRDRLRFPRRRAVAAGGGQQDQGNKTNGAAGDANNAAKKNVTKTPKEELLIRKALLANRYLSKVLSNDQIQDLISVAYQLEVKSGEEVVQEGSLLADRFYIVSTGTFEVRKKVEKQTSTENATSMEAQLQGELSAGGTFGELALLYNAPRAATVQAMSDATLFVIDRHDFKQILRKQAQQRQDFYMKLVEKTELLKVLLKEEKEALCECFVQLHYQSGQTIVREGEEGNTFYIMYQGTVGIHTAKEGKVNTLSADPEHCQYFGEKALVNPECRNASIVVESSSVSLLVLERSTFEQILGPLKEILQDKGNASFDKRKSRVQTNRDKASSLLSSMSLADQKQQQQEKPKMADLHKVGLLGCGGFGSVTLQRLKKTKQVYALKAIGKGYIVRMQMCDQICNERKILSMTNSPFVAQFFGTYNSADFVYFLLEACLGGEVFAQYSRRNFHGSVPHAKFYSACVVKAFEHLHERKIIYRDLKPENMLLDQNGYCKLTDMGLAKFVIGRTYTTCGTPDYFAPEIIQSSGHTNAVDWWCFGILVYELLVGRTPFDGQDPQLRYRKILGGVEKVSFPKQMARLGRLFRGWCIGRQWPGRLLRRRAQPAGAAAGPLVPRVALWRMARPSVCASSCGRKCHHVYACGVASLGSGAPSGLARLCVARWPAAVVAFSLGGLLAVYPCTTSLLAGVPPLCALGRGMAQGRSSGSLAAGPPVP